MKKLSLFLLMSLFAFYGCGDDDFTDTKDGIDNEGSQEGGDENDDEKTYVLDLPTYDAGTLYLGDLEHPDETWEDSYKNKYIKNLLTDKNNIFEFDCISVAYAPSTTFDFSSDSYAFTNNTEGNYSAVTKKGVNNDTYVVVGASGYTEVAIRFKNKNNTNENGTYSVKGLYITNSLFAYGSMKDGDGYYGELEKFGPEDSLKLTIYNLDKTKKVDAYLAEGTNILTSWEWVDLTPLGETNGLKFELTTTKQNEYGPLTPSYFCLDGITLIEK